MALLALLRFVAVTVLAIFLLKPLIRTVDRIVEKPIIVIAQDNSSSLVLGPDSSYYKNEYPTQLNELAASFSEDYEVRTYTFGADVEEGLEQIDYSDAATNFSSLSDLLSGNYSNRNLGAIIIGSDGLYNRGRNPLYNLSSLKSPIYTIAMGDTTVRKDLLISEVRNNRIAYLGNRFPVEVQVDARQLAGQKANLVVSRNGEKLAVQELSFEEDFDQTAIPLILEADKVGLQRYSITLSRLDGEVTYANNSRDVFIDVLDSRQKILILAANPHPDIAALRTALKTNENYDVEAFPVNDFKGDIQDYSMVIFHQLPNGSAEGNEVIRKVKEEEISALYIVGAKTDQQDFNALGTGIELQAYRGGLTELQAGFEANFKLFGISEDMKALSKKLPPLSSPSPDVEFSSGVQSLFTQKIGQIETGKPLLSFFQSADQKVAVLLGEGVWRWGLTDYQSNGNKELFNEIWLKTVQYLSLKKDKSQFRVKGPENVLETDRLIFEAELYNESYEAVTDAEVKLSIRNSEDQEYTYTFSKNGTSFRLDAGQLPVGEYTFKATADRGGTSYTDEGQFVINELKLEEVRTVADHQLLNQLSVKSGGKMYDATSLEGLVEDIRNSGQINSTSYEESNLSDLINLKWILFVLLSLLSIEWLLRKRNGSY